MMKTDVIWHYELRRAGGGASWKKEENLPVVNAGWVPAAQLAALPDSFVETQLTHNKSFIVNTRVLQSFDTWLHLRNHQLGRDNIPY